MTNFKALCAELVHIANALDGKNALISNQGQAMDGYSALAAFRDVADRARAALAAGSDGPAVQSREPASVACEPSDGDLLQLMPEQFRADLGTVSRMAAHGAGPDIKPGLFRVSLNTGALEYARAVLARWGRPAPAPAGEVAESSVAPVPESALARINGILNDSGRVLLTEVREALELAHEALQRRQAAPMPVAVAERLPRPEDCDADGRCWLLTVEDEYPQWRLHSIEGNQPGGSTMIWVPVDSSPGVMVDAFYASHWLPATALPTPGPGEI